MRPDHPRWSILRYVLMHHRSPLASLGHKRRVLWIRALQDAYMRRLVRTGRIEGRINGDGTVTLRGRSDLFLALCLELLASPEEVDPVHMMGTTAAERSRLRELLLRKLRGSRNSARTGSETDA